MTIDLFPPVASQNESSQPEEEYMFDINQKIKSLEKENEELTKKVEQCQGQIFQLQEQQTMTQRNRIKFLKARLQSLESEYAELKKKEEGLQQSSMKRVELDFQEKELREYFFSLQKKVLSICKFLSKKKISGQVAEKFFETQNDLISTRQHYLAQKSLFEQNNSPEYLALRERVDEARSQLSELQNKNQVLADIIKNNEGYQDIIKYLEENNKLELQIKQAMVVLNMKNNQKTNKYIFF